MQPNRRAGRRNQLRVLEEPIDDPAASVPDAMTKAGVSLSEHHGTSPAERRGGLPTVEDAAQHVGDQPHDHRPGPTGHLGHVDVDHQ
ncbi:hypothetical protein [Amycolatopsis sp. RTGN1]|uniref:hypothetical protein n=1 Tax=Amycolatopsis ponsaeliensis TaxID=2992142 RepID=UPI00254CD79C|nr:hypothetical protein [Amycolatopsis sp. RTGN1]